MPDASLSFERFLTGTVNELAVAAARRAAENPGAVYNPLLISGRRGLGKTHLLNAVARYATSLEPDIVVHLDSADRIAARLDDAVEEGTVEQFIESFMGIDILLIDDIEQLAGMERAQAELGTIAHRMSIEGRQMVIASKVAPAEMAGFTPAFIDIMTRGLVVDIHPPDTEMRRTLVDAFAREHRTTLPTDVARALTEREFPDVISIQAAVATVIESAAAEGREPGVDDLAFIVDEEGAGGGADGDAARGNQGDEFGSFLDDVSRTLAAVVETSPWRRRIAEAILRWEGEGVRTSGLDDALLAETTPDVDQLLGEYARDATRLLQIRREMANLGVRLTIDDPADLAAAEAQIASTLAASATIASPGPLVVPNPTASTVADPWFLNPDKVILDWVDLDGRIVLETG